MESLGNGCFRKQRIDEIFKTIKGSSLNVLFGIFKIVYEVW